MAINDPRDISGLVLWLSAEAETGYADGAQVTGWNDLSGNGNHPTLTDSGMTWQATTGPGGGPCIRFAGLGYFTLPNVMAGATAGEIHASIRAGGTSGTSNGSHWHFGIGGYSHYAYNNTINDNFGYSINSLAWNPSDTPASLTSWHRYAKTARTNNTHQSWVNGASVKTGSGTIGFDTAPRLGMSYNRFTGDMAAVIVYNRELTTTERADLDAWLAANPNGGTAASGPPPVSVAGSVATVTVAGHAGAAIVPVAVAGSAASVAVAALAGSVVVGGAPLTVAGSAASVTVTAFAGVATSSVGGAVVAGSVAVVAVVGQAGATLLVLTVGTSTEFANDGYNYDGTAAVYFEPPIAEPPAHIRRVKVLQVHQSMSAPVLVNGRPT